MDKVIEIVRSLIPMTIVIIVGVSAMSILNRRIIKKSAEMAEEGTFRRQMAMTFMSLIFVVAILVTAPLDDGVRGNLISLFGIALTGVIALSSATLASNAMAGLMLRAIQNFKHGDFINCGDLFGRVTERGLFHTEIQNQYSDLITLPNLHLATNPVTVVRSSGSFVAARLSLGYDLQHDEIEDLLLNAAEHAGLVEAFVRIRKLGDFSVTYEIVGRLGDTKKFLGAKSALNRAVLDTLHQAGVEIVSPTFVYQRRAQADRAFIPEIPSDKPIERSRDRAPDAVVFDKADQVEKVEDLRARLTELDKEIGELGEKAKHASEDEAEQIEETITIRKRVRERLVGRIAELEKKVEE